MAMHSYMRANPNQNQTNIASVNLTSDEMHSFQKDKQAWEHAISLYQGPDPLDHWYNYICWYENHAHSDPELKYRETLERCLTIYEHNDYYRQDVRLVRLWLKYIAMQTDQLRFYQVLFQRGTGTQVAAFYIGWASFYEEREQFKDAEEVFNLAFQEKAQSHAELHNAHTKFTYVRNLFYQQQHQHMQQQPQLQQPPTTPAHDALQQLTTYTQTHHQQQQQEHHPQQAQPQQQEHHQTQTQSYTHPASNTNSRPHHLPQANFQQYQTHPQEIAYHAHTQLQQPLQPPPQTHFQHPTQPPTSYDQQFQQGPPAAAHNPAHAHTNFTPEVQRNQPATNAHYESHMQPQVQPQLPTTTAAATAAAATPAAAAVNELPAQQRAHNIESATEVLGVRLPRNFQTYGRNNHETWKPALTLEEPDDPSRVCHYAKNLVYPTGAGIEYSPEELLARKYTQLLEQRKHKAQIQASAQAQPLATPQPQKDAAYAAGQQQQLYDSYSTERSYYVTAMGDELYAQHEEEAEEDQSEGEEADEEAEEDQTESEDEESEDETEQLNQLGVSAKPTYTNGIGMDMQFRAHTTYEQPNRSIKIKFKKERTLESSTYSAYTIENIYHQQQEYSVPETTPAAAAIQTLPESPKPIQDWGGAAAVQRQRNGGHHFHPYMLSHTSTPKSTAQDARRARAKAKHGKFQPDVCSNSNSSCSVADPAAANGVEPVAGQAAATIHNATFNDNANFSFSSAGGMDNSNSSLALAVDRLNFRDASQVANKTLHSHIHNNNNTTTTTQADFSTFQENSYFATQHDAEAQERRLNKALETIERHLAKDVIDPFNSELCRAFLTKLNFPGDYDANASYKVVQTQLPKISNTRTLNVLDSVQFNIDKEVGRGSYGSVYKATDTRTGNVVALKYQKPANTWEVYICDQVLRRVRDPEVLPGLMDISTAIIAPNASLIATEFSPFGSLLDINNKIRQATTKVMHESLVMHFSAQICNIVDHLHRQRIIHADIKPDNFLLMRVPNVDTDEPSLRLIDFGCAIDMTLFPDSEHTKFRKVIQTDGFTCIEMQEGRPWSYETDLFCIASTVHVMLFGEYMQPQKRATGWEIKQKLPRYLKKHVWSKFYSDLLNMQADKLPQLQQMRKIFEEECYRMDSELQKQIRTLSNILHRR